MNKKKLHVKTGDTVKVIAGDDRGKTGRITAVNIEKQRVTVEGINMVTKHAKPSAKNPQGGISKMEAPIHASNVALVDPKSGETTKAGRRKNSEGKTERYSKKSGEVI
ncbi:50S ribosomal protein L24 [Pontibacter sp. FD36]|uniref:Large ribosomal subunit protein uL24 n=2 Tax=Pontibacter TaxID=323449 RepID=A0A1N6TU89_9BACT|nr:MULTISPECIES: 50S ribosomal protein L24 [Pontibacter]EJF10854.1 50S ribosomal protein L24 [Pontibacter sp. BAB1700]MBF8964762.1 50S ribosomal protein L24 [Pontibacter sp. FD36]GGG16941.1 50S ribosomal protein L24 [Pontibacter amylolyticus]SIQ56913.1 LSU ribosomal protein L24P [Pontibacter lucknowensis]